MSSVIEIFKEIIEYCIPNQNVHPTRHNSTLYSFNITAGNIFKYTGYTPRYNFETCENIIHADINNGTCSVIIKFPSNNLNQMRQHINQLKKNSALLISSYPLVNVVNIKLVNEYNYANREGIQDIKDAISGGIALYIKRIRELEDYFDSMNINDYIKNVVELENKIEEMKKNLDTYNEKFLANMKSFLKINKDF